MSDIRIGGFDDSKSGIFNVLRVSKKMYRKIKQKTIWLVSGEIK